MDDKVLFVYNKKDKDIRYISENVKSLANECWNLLENSAYLDPRNRNRIRFLLNVIGDANSTISLYLNNRDFFFTNDMVFEYLTGVLSWAYRLKCIENDISYLKDKNDFDFSELIDFRTLIIHMGSKIDNLDGYEPGVYSRGVTFTKQSKCKISLLTMSNSPTDTQIMLYRYPSSTDLWNDKDTFKVLFNYADLMYVLLFRMISDLATLKTHLTVSFSEEKRIQSLIKSARTSITSERLDNIKSQSVDCKYKQFGDIFEDFLCKAGLESDEIRRILICLELYRNLETEYKNKGERSEYDKMIVRMIDKSINDSWSHLMHSEFYQILKDFDIYELFRLKYFYKMTGESYLDSKINELLINASLDDFEHNSDYGYLKDKFNDYIVPYIKQHSSVGVYPSEFAGQNDLIYLIIEGCLIASEIS